MDVADFRTLYDFNSWANRRTLEASAALTPEQFTRDLGSSFRSVRDTLAHIYGAEWVWLERWHNRTPSGLPVAADFPDFESVRRRLTDIDRNLIDYVASLTPQDIQRIVQFKTLAGVEISQPLWQCLQHLANHGSYHRGQVATMLRQLGAKPTGTDLIGFYRERSAQAGA
ncbi:MAG TPA: DinB family protein [Candidatus Polarisedimenticolia bacterium]|nr:DinB family protein [Candidatus Polarisedimenticolia bacterium]